MLAQRLVVFLRAPRVGSVKTRLAAEMGEAATCVAYRQLVGTLLEGLASLPSTELCFTPADAAAEIAPWLAEAWSAHPQASGDLGARLHAAFERHFRTGAERVVVIGSDCPDVQPEDVAAAWDALRTHDVVLGPASDGGYWLIGLRHPQAGLFAAMPWSTNEVFAETRRRAVIHGLSVALLRELTDVDSAADWKNWVCRAGLLRPPGDDLAAK